MNRRGFLTAAAALAPAALAQTQRDWSGKEPIRYSDPDVVPLDKQFDKYKINNTHIERVWTGALWAEGPAWSGQGRYLVWSDIPNNRQMRWMEEDGHVSTFRVSDYSNGNTFDYQGRQVSCEHALQPACAASSLTAPSPSSPTSSTASRSIRPTTSSCIPMAPSGSPTRATASWATTKASRRSRS